MITKEMVPALFWSFTTQEYDSRMFAVVDRYFLIHDGAKWTRQRYPTTQAAVQAAQAMTDELLTLIPYGMSRSALRLGSPPVMVVIPKFATESIYAPLDSEYTKKIVAAILIAVADQASVTA